MIRVLLADDQALVRSGIRIILDSEPDIEVVAEAENGELAVAAAAATAPDVICMDVEMPVMSGIEATRQIIQATANPANPQDTRPAAPAVLMLTTFGHEEYLFDALSAGASGFLLKTSRAAQLIDAVRVLAEGGSLLGPEVTGAVLSRVRGAAGHTQKSTDADRSRSTTTSTLPDSPTQSQRPVDAVQPPVDALQAAVEAAGLTARERSVLELLAKGSTNAEIAIALFLGEATVKTHVSNVLQKLGVRDRLQAVVWVHTRG